jgi:hypothetical protein
MKFTHLYDRVLGWSSTNIKPSDFDVVEELGWNRFDGIVYLAISATGRRYIFRDNSNVKVIG